MRNVFKQIGIIALVAVVGFSFAALSLTGCGSGDGGGGGPNPVMRTVTFDANGGTVEGTATKDVKVENGKKVKMPTDPENGSKFFWGWFDNDTSPYGNCFTGTIPVTADKTVYARWDDNEPPPRIVVTFDANGGTFAGDETTQDIEVYPGEKVIPPWASNGDYLVSGWNSQRNGKGSVFDKNNPITVALTVYAQWDKPEDMPDKDRWSAYRDPSSSATLEDYSIDIDDDGSCTVTLTVGGKPEKQGVDNVWRAWTVTVEYFYTGVAGKMYEYTFEAWTESGTRDMNAQYYTDNDDEIYLGETKQITTTPTTYTVLGEPLPKGGLWMLSFHCANQIGTVHIKMLNIKEYTRTILTITGIGSNYGHWVEPAGLFDANGTAVAVNRGAPVANNRTLTLVFWDIEDEEKPWNKAGNYLIAMSLWGKDNDNDGDYIYTGGKNLDYNNLGQYTYTFAEGGQYTINFNQFRKFDGFYVPPSGGDEGGEDSSNGPGGSNGGGGDGPAPVPGGGDENKAGVEP